jgi:plastocyanin
VQGKTFPVKKEGGEMETMKRYAVIVCVMFAIGMVSGAVNNVAAAEKGGAQMVTMKKEPAGVSPNPVKVKAGTTIIWINYDPEPVSIRFKTRIGYVCGEVVNFYADLFDSYESTGLPQGGIASICFIEKGTYDYEVRRLKGKDKQYEEVSGGSVIIE